MGPLSMSAKQHREYLKLQSQEQREAAKMEREESRKNQLHEIKLQEAAVKANQGIGHKEDLHAAKLKELGSPLGKPPKLNREKMGLPSINPMAGTGVFTQGQHKMYAQGTDTVPAMLTPGEAVIPAPAAQNPKNKKAIQRMVQEGRKQNKLRDGAVSVVNSDTKRYAQGTMQVPSLAYEHPDVPGSSFEDGTESVYDRGSSAQANYNDGTYGVVPQQVQSAVGYADGIPEVPEWDASYTMNVQLPQPSEGVQVADANDYYNSLGSQYGVSDVVPTKQLPVPVKKEAVLPNSDYFNSLSEEYGVPAQQTKPVTVVDVLKPADVAASTKPVVAPGTSQTQKVAVVPTVKGMKPTDVSIGGIPYASAEDNAALDVPKVPVDPNAVDATAQQGPRATPVDYTNAQAASTALQSKQDRIKDYMKMQGYDVDAPKDDKGFLESFKNALSYSGAKDALGLNNQEVARMAVMAAAGRMRGYDFGRSLAYAGKNMFMEASKRAAQESTDKAAAMRNAVTMDRDDTRAEQADKRAAAKEIHERFVAQQQVKMAEIKDEFNRDRDAAKQEHQLRLLMQQGQQHIAALAQQGHQQLAMMYAREQMQQNSPMAQLQRLEQHTEKAASAVSQIYDRDLGSDNIKGQANPNRTGLPVPKQVTQQGLSFLKRSGIDITNPDIAQEATAVINQATEQMIADKKSGRVSGEIKDVTPYVARNVVTHRMGLDASLFNVGNKPMPPEKVSEVYGLARRAATDKDGNVNQANLAAGVNKVAEEWNSPNGKKYREQFKGTETETAFAQFLKAKLLNQVK